MAETKNQKCLLVPDQACRECGECDRCDLNPEKLCDNCCACLGQADYRAIVITEIQKPAFGEEKEPESGFEPEDGDRTEPPDS